VNAKEKVWSMIACLAEARGFIYKHATWEASRGEGRGGGGHAVTIIQGKRLKENKLGRCRMERKSLTRRIGRNARSQGSLNESIHRKFLSQ